MWEQIKDSLGLREREFQQDLQNSQESRRLLENPLLQRFFTETESSLIEQWQSTAPGQIEEREVAYRMLLLSRKFKQYFETFLANEEYARQQLDEIAKEAA